MTKSNFKKCVCEIVNDSEYWEHLDVYQCKKCHGIINDAFRKAYFRPIPPVVRDGPKQRRNALCFCQSGKKFKKCCGGV